MIAELVDLRAGGLLELCVGCALLVGELDFEHLFDLVGQIREHVLLATEQIRADAAREPRPEFAARAGKKRRLVAILEVAARAEIARQQELEERPQIAHGFSIGVPVRMNRLAARSAQADFAFWLSGFLMCWASSR